MTPTLDVIAHDTGTLAMVAMDQRESLRTMFAEAGRPGVPDEVLVDFKLHVARELGTLASGFLIDRHFGDDEARRALTGGTGFILAADELTQDPGGPVEETDLDLVVVGPDFDLAGVDALKLLIIWRRDEKREARVRLAERFIAAARERGVLSVLEPVVRQAPGERDWDQTAAIREAARELSPLGPSLYKVQVPRGGAGEAAELRAACEALARDIVGPWVVLSQGVALGDFHDAVRTACRAGASGFLAGRALWSDVVGSADVAHQLREVSVPRLERLIDTVDATARPWGQA